MFHFFKHVCVLVCARVCVCPRVCPLSVCVFGECVSAVEPGRQRPVTKWVSSERVKRASIVSRTCSIVGRTLT